jgi:hypothetical protein
MVFSPDIIGEHVIAEGVFKTNQPLPTGSEKMCAHRAKELAEGADPTAETNCFSRYQINANGLVVKTWEGEGAPVAKATHAHEGSGCPHAKTTGQTTTKCVHDQTKPCPHARATGQAATKCVHDKTKPCPHAKAKAESGHKGCPHHKDKAKSDTDG